MNYLKIKLKVTTISRRKSNNQELEVLPYNVPPSKPLFEFVDDRNGEFSSPVYRQKESWKKLDRSFFRLLVGPSFFLSSYTVWHHFP